MEQKELVNSLTKVEYLTTFNAFIYGYIISRFLAGWGKLVENRKHVIFSVEHILWSIFAFFMLISLWWNSWGGMRHISTSSWSFYTTLFSPLLMYMISSLYFPEFRETEINLGKDSKFQRRQSAILYFILFLYNLLQEYFREGHTEHTVYYLVGATSCIIVYFSRKRWIGQLNLGVGFITMGIFVINLPAYSKTNYWLIQDFAFSEYLATFLTFLFGFIIARFLDGWIKFSYHRRLIKFNIDYLLWTVLIFGTMIDFWWGLWQRSLVSSLNIFNFLVSLLVPMSFYLLSSLLFQNSQSSLGQRSFSKNYQLIFGAIIIIFVADFLSSTFVSQRPLSNPENIYRLFATILCAAALLKNNRVLHRVILILGWILLLLHNIFPPALQTTPQTL
jgi:hypothetical protein